MGKRRFIIEVDGVYYMTSGPLLVYDADKSKGNQQMADGAEEVAKKFNSVDSASRYSAVEVTDANFAAANYTTE